MAKQSRPNQALIDALVEAKIITDPSMVNRIVIDIRGVRSPEIHAQQRGDSDALAGVVEAIARDMPTFDPTPGDEPLG